MFEVGTKGAAQRTAANKFAPNEQLGEAVHKTMCMLKCVYDFSVNGGAQGAINLLDDAGNSAILPKGAVVVHAWAYVKTNVTSGGSATISLDVLTTADLQAATAKASLVTSVPFIIGKPIRTGATVVGPVTAAAGSHVTATIGSADVTAGKVEYYLEYFITG
jgi:hypothetical protein